MYMIEKAGGRIMCDFKRDMFDLNGDGKVDIFEPTTAMMMLDDIFRKDNDMDLEDEDLEEELELAGLDRDELELIGPMSRKNTNLE